MLPTHQIDQTLRGTRLHAMSIARRVCSVGGIPTPLPYSTILVEELAEDAAGPRGPGTSITVLLTVLLGRS